MILNEFYKKECQEKKISRDRRARIFLVSRSSPLSVSAPRLRSRGFALAPTDENDSFQLDGHARGTATHSSSLVAYGPRSSPYDGWLKVPPTLMGTTSPAFFFSKNGSRDLSRTDLIPFDPLESLLSSCKLP